VSRPEVLSFTVSAGAASANEENLGTRAAYALPSAHILRTIKTKEHEMKKYESSTGRTFRITELSS
jgi:hypothetical protein